MITRIGYDHMNILGNTIEEIAQEKAGIIKAGVPVVIAPPGIGSYLRCCKGRPQQREYVRGVYRRMTCRGQRQYSRDFWVLIRGENAATAMCAAQVAWTRCRIEKEKMKTVIARGIHRAVWPGAYGNFKYRTVSDGGWCTQQ